MKRRLAVLVLAVACLLSWGGPAFGLIYATGSHPIKIEANNNDGNGALWGRVSLENRTGMRSAYHYKDTSSDKNGVYVTTTWYFWRTCITDVCWDYADKDRSSDTQSTDYVGESDWEDLDGNADRGRGVVKACENQKWSPDPCSKRATVTLGY